MVIEMTQTTIYFDMDGTLAGLFYVKDFSKKLADGDMTPYLEARPLYNLDNMNKVISLLKANGYEIGIISYVDKKHPKESRQAKKQWLAKYFPYATEIHLVQEYKTKFDFAKCKNGILIDDAKKNLNAWKGQATINAYRANLVNELYQLIN